MAEVASPDGPLTVYSLYALFEYVTYASNGRRESYEVTTLHRVLWDLTVHLEDPGRRARCATRRRFQLWLELALHEAAEALGAFTRWLSRSLDPGSVADPLAPAMGRGPDVRDGPERARERLTACGMSRLTPAPALGR